MLCFSVSIVKMMSQKGTWGIVLCPERLKVRPISQPTVRELGVSFKTLKSFGGKLFLGEVRKVFRSVQSVCIGERRAMGKSVVLYVHSVILVPIIC